MKNKTSKFEKAKKKPSIDVAWELINPHAAGVDIGARKHWACVPTGSSPSTVRVFGTFTADLEAMAQWFKECGVTSVAMEATGVYWVALFQILERRGFKVVLANARQTKNVSGRKTDVLDCQWIQRLHMYGLLQGSFRPADPYCVLRTYTRYRDELIAARGTQCQHMQKALQQMNLSLTQVLSDVTGASGLAIIGAILQGERDPVKLASLVDRRVRATSAQIQQALVGDYRPEQLFVLRQAYELYHSYEEKISRCDQQLVEETGRLCNKVDIQAKPLPERKAGRKPPADKMAGVDMREVLYQKFGVDLTAVEGFGVVTALTLLAEVGTDLSRFPTEKHFCSWLGLCPDNRITGGRVMSSRTRRVVNRATDALRLAAFALERSGSALGAYHRRMKARLGAAEAITATAHKLARIFYRLIKHGEAYVRQGLNDYEAKYRGRKLRALIKSAQAFGLEIAVPDGAPAPGVS